MCLFFFGLEHTGGDSGDEAAGDEAFTVGAEIISEAGNDVALARREGFQTGVRYFFSGLRFANKLILSRDDVKFGFG